MDRTGIQTRQSEQMSAQPTSSLKQQPLKDLRKHLLPCAVCGKEFPNKSSLQKHNRKAHLVTRDFTCNSCNKSFKEENHLTTHKLIHQEKQHSWKICNKAFAQKGNLMWHYRTHSGEKLYSCETFGQNFKQLSHLKVHYRHHDGEKPFVCINCNKFFTQASNLVEYSKIHHDHQQHNCEVCGKSFKRSQYLKVHEFFHTQVRTFGCLKILSLNAERNSSQKNIWKKHTKRVHSDKMSFRRQSQQSQQKRPHDQTIPSPCRGCGKYLKQAGIFIKEKQRCHCT